MSFSGNFQRPNPPIPPQAKPPAQSEEEKALAEQKRRIEEDLKKAQADLKKTGRDAFVASTSLQQPVDPPTSNHSPFLKPERLIGLLFCIVAVFVALWIVSLLFSH